GHVDENVLDGRGVITGDVRILLERPDGLAGIGITGEDRVRPLVGAWPLGRVPRAGIAIAVEEEPGLGVVGDPAPDGATPYLPLPGRPCRDSQVLAAILRVIGLEVGADQAVLVRSGAVGPPDDRAVAHVERRDPAA